MLSLSVGCGGAETSFEVCEEGTERCACFANATCHGSLQCFSGLCVDRSASETGGVGGTVGSDGGDAGTAGVPGSGGSSGGPDGDPLTCADTANTRSYVGCEFWPTVTANTVWDIFDYVVVVANAGTAIAKVEVTLGGAVIRTTQVSPNGVQKIYLPWVPLLKGPEGDACGSAQPNTESVHAARGAYHLTSSEPITAYQFNALEYQGQGGGRRARTGRAAPATRYARVS